MMKIQIDYPVTIGRVNKNSFIPFIFTISSLNFILGRWIGFSMVDETIVFILFLFGIYKTNLFKNKEFRVYILSLVIFLVYSLFFGVNVPQAALFDFLLFLKPFFSFFVAFLIPFQLTENIRKLYRNIFVLTSIYCIIQAPFIEKIYPNTSAYYSICLVSALSFLFFSKLRKVDLVFAIFVITFGFLSKRAKFVTEYVFILGVIFLVRNKIKLDLKYIILLLILGTIAIYLSWAKFELYFINGIEEEAVRSIMYSLVPEILRDYFPFGPGLGSFNTEGAAKFYSPLYRIYNVDYIWGMRQIDYKTDADFLKDTFYPALSELGIFGYVGYIWFWYKRWIESKKLSLNSYKLFLIVFMIVSIQNIADNCFTSESGVFYLMLLGMLVNKSKVNLNRI